MVVITFSVAAEENAISIWDVQYTVCIVQFHNGLVEKQM